MSEIFNPLLWPALVKVLAVFALVVTVSRFKLHLGFCLAGGGLLLGLWMGLGPGRTVAAAALAVASPVSLRLALAVAFMLVLSHLMKESGQLERIVASFSRLVSSPKVTAAVMPAIIGLLPMPGGALFSAPMVEASCPAHGAGPGRGELLAAVNYWFRHHGEYWWPMYPGFILAVSLLGVDTLSFMLIMAPLAMVHLAAGVWFLLRRLPEQPSGRSGEEGSVAQFLKECAPILVMIAVVVLVSALGALWGQGGPPWPDGTALISGLAGALIAAGKANRVSPLKVLASFGRREVLSLLGLVAGVMIFQGLMKGSGAVDAIQGELKQYGIPALAMIALLPFISGLVTGIAVGYVAASLPVIVPLISHLSGIGYLAHGMLAFAAGFFGMMLSPLHLCFLLSRDYFKCSLAACYPYLYGPLAVTAAALAGWYLLLA
jgi:integral membrane protein (TIGR00529 family)